jgi:hypothetical protein
MFNGLAHFGSRGLGDDARTGDAVRYGLAAVGIGAALLIAGAVWMSTCAGATADDVACGVPQRTLLALAAPAVLLAAGLRAFVRAYQSSRRSENWRVWQRAALTLMAVTLLALTLALPMLAKTG